MLIAIEVLMACCDTQGLLQPMCKQGIQQALRTAYEKHLHLLFGVCAQDKQRKALPFQMCKADFQ